MASPGPRNFEIRPYGFPRWLPIRVTGTHTYTPIEGGYRMDDCDERWWIGRVRISLRIARWIYRLTHFIKRGLR